MIVARNLSKRFGKVAAVDSINFRIPSGRVVGFLGPNGAGKTTTIRMITGFLPPTSGSVEVDGIDVRQRPKQVRRRIGYLPESTPLYPEMRVVEYVRFRAAIAGVRGRSMRRRVEFVLDRCGLGEMRRRPIANLSKGYRQRVGLAAALVHDPPVLILDEPTVGLDPAQIREVRGLIRDLAGDHTVLLSTHILPEAELACDDVIVLARGTIRAQGTVSELRDQAARDHRYLIETERSTAAPTIEALPSVAHVDALTLDDGWNRLHVTPTASAGDLREMLGRTLRKHGSAVRELTRAAPTLEQMFIELIAGGTRVDTGDAPPPPSSSDDAGSAKSTKVPPPLPRAELPPAETRKGALT